MNSNTLKESPTISMEQQLKSSTLLQENQVTTAQQLEPMTQSQIQLPILVTGLLESNQILMPSAHHSQPKKETNFVNPSSNLKSNVKPHALLEKPPELRILKVSKEDIASLCQVISEFQEQFIGY